MKLTGSAAHAAELFQRLGRVHRRGRDRAKRSVRSRVVMRLGRSDHRAGGHVRASHAAGRRAHRRDRLPGERGFRRSAGGSFVRDASRERRGGGRGDHLSGPSSARHELVYGRGRRGTDARSGDATARARSVRVRRNGWCSFGNALNHAGRISLDSAIVSTKTGLRTGTHVGAFSKHRGITRVVTPGRTPSHSESRLANQNRAKGDSRKKSSSRLGFLPAAKKTARFRENGQIRTRHQSRISEKKMFGIFAGS